MALLSHDDSAMSDSRIEAPGEMQRDLAGQESVSHTALFLRLSFLWSESSLPTSLAKGCCGESHLLLNSDKI